MSEQKKARIRALNKMVQSWGDVVDVTYYVYAYYDPGCSCCSCQHDFDEFTSLEDAIEYAEHMKDRDYRVTLLAGEELFI